MIMNLHFKKLMLLGTVFLLAACQPNGPSIESLQKLRDVDSGIEITNSRIKSVTTVNESLSLYDIEGMFKYRDGRYAYLTDVGNIKIFTPLNGEETTPFNANIIASENNGAWDIVSENLPRFAGPTDNSKVVLNHQALFANSSEQIAGVFTHADGSRFMLNDKALDKNVKLLIREYENLLKENIELDKKLLSVEETLADIDKAAQKSAKKDTKTEASAEDLDLIVNQTLSNNQEYHRVIEEKKNIQNEIKILHEKMPQFWNFGQCYETDYRFYGRICNQITGVNRDYLPKIRYVSRPDADPQYLD